jgi:hypothetical protein
MRLYDNIDLVYSWNGDYNLDQGDLKDTSEDTLLSILQDIHTLSSSNRNDWELYKSLTAGLDEFIGEPNNRDTANKLHDSLRLSIITLGIVAEEDLTIKIIPIHTFRVLIVIKIKALATPYNNLGQGESLTTHFVFDFIEQGHLFFEKIPILREQS